MVLVEESIRSWYVIKGVRGDVLVVKKKGMTGGFVEDDTPPSPRPRLDENFAAWRTCFPENSIHQNSNTRK